jgi:hypothetical protein
MAHVLFSLELHEVLLPRRFVGAAMHPLIAIEIPIFTIANAGLIVVLLAEASEMPNYQRVQRWRWDILEFDSAAGCRSSRAILLAKDTKARDRMAGKDQVCFHCLSEGK